jgi:hypothetical protein
LIVSEDDARRLGRIAEAWTRALGLVRQPQGAGRVTAEGDLLRPDAAEPRAMLPPGSYRCRTFTFRPPARGRPALSIQGPHFCHVGVEGQLMSFTKQTGPQRPGGYLYEDGDTRSIFVGAVAAGRERVPPAYGTQPDRDVVGIVERVGPFRYRLVVPWPRNGAVLEVVELKPAVQ